MTSTRIGRHIAAPRAEVYRLLLDAEAVATWLVPEGMTGRVLTFEPHEGGAVHLAIGTGDFRARFLTLVPDEQVVQAIDTGSGETRIVLTLSDADGGTDLVALHDGPPPSAAPEETELAWRLALGKLAALAEGGAAPAAS